MTEPNTVGLGRTLTGLLLGLLIGIIGTVGVGWWWMTSHSGESMAEVHSGHEMTTEEDDILHWTCGMHPQIVQDEPGTCPVCGMDLVEKKK